MENFSDLIDPAPASGGGIRYNRHSQSELERAVYIDPTNTTARDEMLARATSLIDDRSDEFQEMEMQLDAALKEVGEYEVQSDADDAEITALGNKLAEAEARIAELTFATDLA